MPVLDLFLWNTVLRDWASHEVFAAMLFPRDAAQRNQYLAVNAALWREQHADVPTKIMIEIHCFLPVGGLATLVQSDAAHTIKERAAQAGAEGSIAGDMLLLIWQMFQEGTEKPSVNKAKHVLQHAYRTTVKTGEGLRTAANNAFFSRVWSAYLPVAHLWAAGHLTQHDPAIPSGTPGLGELLDPVLLPSFLARAELFRLFGERYIPHAQRAPLLPPSETWTVPVSFPLPDVTLPTMPLQPNERAALRSYRASTGPSPPSWLLLPNPRKCKMRWDGVVSRTGKPRPRREGSVGVRYTHDGRQGQSRKPVNIGSVPLFSDRSWCGSVSLS